MTNSDNGFDLIEDVFNSWLLYKVQYDMLDYLMTLKLRKVIFAIATFLSISFLISGFFILQLLKKKRLFIAKIGELSKPIKILMIASCLLFNRPVDYFLFSLCISRWMDNWSIYAIRFWVFNNIRDCMDIIFTSFAVFPEADFFLKGCLCLCIYKKG